MTVGRVVTLGETMAMVRSHFVGSLATESEMRLGVGGAESNVAIGLARLGTAATWIGRVGDDSLGTRILRELRAEGVTVSAAIDSDAATGLMLKERLTPDSTRVLYYRSGGAGSRLSTDDVDPDVVGSADLLHVTGITPALSESAADAVAAAIDLAHEARTLVSFDVNHRSSLWRDRDAGQVYRELAKRADVVFAGEDEAILLAPGRETPRDLAHAIAEFGPRQVVVKLGERGCFALLDGVDYWQPAVAVRSVDTVGAGDAFVAGYLSELVRGTSPEQRLLTAVRTGAFACLGSGDWESYAHRADLALLDASDPVAR